MREDLISYIETAVTHYGIQETLKKSIVNLNRNLQMKDDQIKNDQKQKFGLNPSLIELLERKITSDLAESENILIKENFLKIENNNFYQLGGSNQREKLQRFAEFQLLGILGRGGMGVVYEGIQKSLNRTVAIKKSNTNIRFLAQIYHEAQITAFLDHPNILTVHDFGIDQNGYPIQVMKKIDGITWSTLLYNPEHDFWEDLEIESNPETRFLFHLDVLSKVAQAIDYAHKKHVIHRDLKPENIMIGKFGEIFILDWGIALYIGPEDDLFIAQKHSNLKDLLVGTPAYMAPEQVYLLASQTPATDIYLLGAILYEIVHLSPLHKGENIQELLMIIRENQLPRLSENLNQEIKNLLNMSLKTIPSHRIQSAKIFRKHLQTVISSVKSKQLEIKGTASFNELQQLLKDENILNIKPIHQSILTLEEQKRENAIDDCFDRARHYLTSSLELFEQNEFAKMNLQELLSLWIKRCTQKQDFRQAYRYLKELPMYEFHLEFNITNAKHKLDVERQKIQALKEWQDDLSIQKSKSPRFYFALFCFIFLGLGSLSIYFLSLYDKYQDSAKGRFYAAFFLTLMSMIVSETWIYLKAQKEHINQAFNNFKYFIYMVFFFVTLARFIGWQFHNQLDLLLLHEMPLASFATFTIGILLKKNDFLIGGVCFSVCSICAVLFPDQISLFYAIAQFILWLSVLVIYTIETKTSQK